VRPFLTAQYLSVVGFLFLDTRLRGLPVPFHRNFEEVNLRFYDCDVASVYGDRFAEFLRVTSAASSIGVIAHSTQIAITSPVPVASR